MKGSRSRRGSSLIVTISLALAVGIAGGWYLLRRTPSREAANPVEGPATGPLDMPELADTRRLIELAKPIIVGDTAAPIVIMEFADYSCGHCKEFHDVELPRLDLAFIKEGRAQLAIYEFPFPIGPHSFLAARAARCAGDQGKYIEYSDQLFDNQLIWAPKRDMPLGDFTTYASSIQLDVPRFRQCVESQENADVVTANKRFGDALGVPGTPTIFIQAKGQMWKRVADWSAEGIGAAIEAVGKP